MRLLHLIHTPRHSGAEVLVRDLSLEHLAAGVESAVAAFAPSAPEFEGELSRLRAAGVSTFVPRRPLGGFSRVLAYAKSIDRFRPDAIFAHATLPSLYGRAGRLLSGSRAPFVGVLHSATDDYADWKLRVAEKILGSQADAIIAVSDSASERFSRRVRKHAPLEIVRNGVNLERFRNEPAKREQLRASLGLEPAEKVVIQIGRISPLKQQIATLDALTPLLRTRPEVKIWFVGLVEDASYHEAFQARISEITPGRIKFLGPRNDIPDLLCAADVYVMPSKSEAHSIAFLEAAASGIPIVASNIESFSFAAGQPAITLIDPAMADVYCAAVVASLAIGPKNRSFVSEYSLQTTAQEYARIASNLIREM